MSDEVISECWACMVRDGTAKIVFRDAEVGTASALIRFLKDPGNLPVFFVGEHNSLLGFAWLNQFGHNHAFAHFSLFREAWGVLSHEIGRQVIKYWWGFRVEGEPVLRVLLGNIPAANEKARSYVRRLGFEEIARIPHIASAEGGAMVIHILVRDNG